MGDSAKRVQVSTAYHVTPSSLHCPALQLIGGNFRSLDVKDHQLRLDNATVKAGTECNMALLRHT